MVFIRRCRNSLAALALGLLLAGVASACPTCKDQLAHDPAAANMARGYAYSILFMLSMPPLIFGSLCAYFYWEVRKARAQPPEASLLPLAGSVSGG
jgi:hypothetical protein